MEVTLHCEDNWQWIYIVSQKQGVPTIWGFFPWLSTWILGNCAPMHACTNCLRYLSYTCACVQFSSFSRNQKELSHVKSTTCTKNVYCIFLAWCRTDLRIFIDLEFYRWREFFETDISILICVVDSRNQTRVHYI